MRVLALFMVILGGCDDNEPPSEQCRNVWTLDRQLQAVPTRTVDDVIRKNAIHQHALWCNQNPSGVWL